MKPQLGPSESPLHDEVSESIALDEIEAGAPITPSAVGVVVDELHPVLAGRVRVRLGHEGPEGERWLPCLMGIRPRSGDRVLVIRPSGAQEGVVLGVLDGFRQRLEPEARATNVRTIADDESVRIEAADGRGLVEVRASENGCVVRLLSPDATLAAEGTLTIEAQAVALRAKQGCVALRASEDVEIQGEHVRLN